MGADGFVGDAGCAQFVAQGADVGVDGVRVGGAVAAEHGGEQFFAAEHAAGAVQQGAQQAVFALRERQFAPLVADAAGGCVVVPYWYGFGFGGGLGLCAPQHGFYAGDEFARAEGFADVVVCAEFEAEDAVGFFVLGGEHDDGLGVLRAQGFEQFEAVGVGQADVEQEQVEVFAREKLPCLLGGGGDACGEVGAGEGEFDQFGDFAFVFDDEDMRVHGEGGFISFEYRAANRKQRSSAAAEVKLPLILRKHGELHTLGRGNLHKIFIIVLQKIDAGRAYCVPLAGVCLGRIQFFRWSKK